MITTYKDGFIYSGGESEEWKVGMSREVKIQGVGSGTYTLLGKMTAEADFAPLQLISTADFSLSSSASDTNIYAADVAGLHSIKVVASGFDRVFACAYGF